MQKIVSFLFVILALANAAGGKVYAQKHKTDDILGTWLNEERTAKVQVYKDGAKYFGKIVWLKETLDKVTGKPRTDDLNPDVKLRNTPLMGLILLRSFVFDGDDEWTKGTIYDPKNGKTYSCYIRFDTPQILKIRGYIGISILGRTTNWFKTY
ncbi:MAG: DUF2147 domain-containing protein [Bacteroidetes bacterium]|nr:DUF2147 domain-containing protein [Bacteroidota bacterium]